MENGPTKGTKLTPGIYVVSPAVVAPVVLSIVAVVAAFRDSWWWLAALPVIWLGSVCAQPNLNAADGCLAYFSILIGFAITPFFRPLGEAIISGAVSGLFISALEKWIRMRPASDL